MYIMLFKEVFRDPVLFTHRTDITDTGSCGFFHDISHLSGQKDFSLSRHDINLDLQCISAHTGPCQSPDNSHFIRFSGHLIGIQLFSQISGQVSLCDMHFFLFAFQDLFCGFPADVTDLALQLTHACFLRIISCHLPERFFADGQLFFRKAVPFQLFRDQMLHRNVHLFIFRIA